MRQLMREQAPPLIRSRREAACAKYNVVTHCIRIGMHLLCRLFGGCVGMHPHSRKVLAEALPHVLLHHWLQWDAGAGKDVVYTDG